MKDERRNYVIVGGFVLAMLAALILWLALISGRTGASDSYWIRYANVMGLNEGTKVLFEGYPVGSVSGVSPIPLAEGGGFRVGVSVRSGWPIPEDSVAVVTAGGLLAAVVIDIENGQSPNTIPPGDEIPSAEASGLVEALSSVAQQVEGISGDAQSVLGSLAERVPEIMEEAQALVATLNETAGRLDRALSDGNVTRVDNIFVSLEETASNAAKLSADLGETRARLDRLLGSLDSMAVDNQEDIRRIVLDLRSSLDQVSRYIPAITQNLESSMRNLNEFTGVIRENPGVLLRGRRIGDDPGGSQ